LLSRSSPQITIASISTARAIASFLAINISSSYLLTAKIPSLGAAS
jgi:hypothetical protein